MHEVQSEFEHTRAPLLEHLLELRRRLLYCVIAYGIAFCICYNFAEEIYSFLVQPLANAYPDHESRRMIYTGLTEAFMTYMQLGFFGAIFLAFPFIAFQLYRFIAPGLYKKERMAVIPFLIAAPVLFMLGAALAYYYVFPMAWEFFLSFETGDKSSAVPIVMEARVSEYLSLVEELLIAFGLAFQLPVVLTLLARAGVIDAESLAKWRKYAIVIIVTAAGILTPPDIFSQIGLSIPLYLLYELSIISCRLMAKQHKETLDA